MDTNKFEMMESVTPKVKVTEERKDELAKTSVSYGDFMGDTPKWAKIVRFIGWGLTAIGGALLTVNPVTVPIMAPLIPYAGYLVFGGTAAGAFVQGFSKKK